MQCERKGGVRDDSNDFVLGNWKIGIAIFWDAEDYRRTKFGVKRNQEFDFRQVKFEMTNKHTSGEVKMVVK